MPSLRHNIIWTLLRLSGFRFKMGKDARKNRVIRDNPPSGLSARIKKEMFQDHPIWRIRLSNSPKAPPVKTLYHLHGGGHVYGVLSLHFKVLAKLADLAQVEIILPCYPLPPDFQASGVNAFCRDHFEHIVSQKGLSNITLSGDSAGAGLALILAANRRDAGHPNPSHMILMSPWVNLAMDHPQSEAYDKCAILDLEGLRFAAARYAGKLGVSHPQVSAAKADMTNLPDMTIFAGDRDLLFPDIRDFAENLRGVDLRIAKGMGHYWMFFPQSEAITTWNETAALIGG